MPSFVRRITLTSRRRHVAFNCDLLVVRFRASGGCGRGEQARPTTSGDISVYLGPREFGAPDDLLLPILESIGRAKSQQNLMIAIQEIDSPAIAEQSRIAQACRAEIDRIIDHCAD